MIVARELLARLVSKELPIPATITDVWFTRDGDAVFLLMGDLPSQFVTPIFYEAGDGTAGFLRWDSHEEIR